MVYRTIGFIHLSLANQAHNMHNYYVAYAYFNPVQPHTILYSKIKMAGFHSNSNNETQYEYHTKENNLFGLHLA